MGDKWYGKAMLSVTYMHYAVFVKDSDSFVTFYKIRTSS
jgi:hypothetical protein